MLRSSTVFCSVLVANVAVVALERYVPALIQIENLDRQPRAL